MVAPSPELNEQIKQELSRLKKRVPGVLSSMVRVKDREAPGLNDGLIYPGEMFTLGTPVRRIRDAALQRTPLHGVVRVIVVLAQFTDKIMFQSKQHFQDLFFSEGVLPNGSVQEILKK